MMRIHSPGLKILTTGNHFLNLQKLKYFQHWAAFISCILSSVSYLLSRVPLLLFHFSCLLSHFSCLLSQDQLSNVSQILTPVSCACLLSPVSCFLFPVSCLLSFVSCLLYHCDEIIIYNTVLLVKTVWKSRFLCRILDGDWACFLKKKEDEDCWKAVIFVWFYCEIVFQGSKPRVVFQSENGVPVEQLLWSWQRLWPGRVGWEDTAHQVGCGHLWGESSVADPDLWNPYNFPGSGSV